MIIKYRGKAPVIHKDAFVAPNATIIGDVLIEEGASIWYGAVLRGDMAPIRIGKNSNIQDNATVHTDSDKPSIIGENVTVGHNAVIHGCTVEDNALIGIGAIVLNNAIVNSGVVVAAASLVKENSVCEKSTLVAGVPATTKKTLENSEEHLRQHAMKYVTLAKEHAREID
ncbi:MAG TPA: gamma carbonic anhydrase family protein [Thermotogota bacterium]|nr:gamma carbonic anhydrase family protein [Thermotogota bacterium]